MKALVLAAVALSAQTTSAPEKPDLIITGNGWRAEIMPGIQATVQQEPNGTWVVRAWPRK